MFLTDFWVIRYNIVSNSSFMYVIIRKRFKKDKSREEEGGIQHKRTDYSEIDCYFRVEYINGSYRGRTHYPTIFTL